MTVTLRKAMPSDQAAIRRLIYASGINPLGLNWRRFVVAEADGMLIGTGQIKPHGDGSFELASIAVAPNHRKAGIATRLINTLLSTHPGTLYLLCRPDLENFYQRFGFRRLMADEMPPYFRRITGVAGGLIAAVRRVGIHFPSPIVMEREIQ